MPPTSYLVLQPCDVIAGMMTSSVTVLPSSQHAVTSFKSLPPVISPYVSHTNTMSTLGSIGESTACFGTGTGLDNPGVNPDYCLSQSANQVTRSIVEATPRNDGVTGNPSVAENGSRDHDCTSGYDGPDEYTNLSNVTSCSEVEKDGGGGWRRQYPLYCSVCRVRLNGSEQAREHFEGRTHARRLKLTSSSPSRSTDSAQQVSRYHFL